MEGDKKQQVRNPKYTSWNVKDQQLLSYLLNSITKDLLAVVEPVTLSAEAWRVLETVFSVQSSVCVTNLRHVAHQSEEGWHDHCSILQQDEKHQG